MMTDNPESQPSSSGIARLLNLALSLSFLVLAAYIALTASSLGGTDARDMRLFALLVGAYGIWRMIRTVLRGWNRT